MRQRTIFYLFLSPQHLAQSLAHGKELGNAVMNEGGREGKKKEGKKKTRK